MNMLHRKNTLEQLKTHQNDQAVRFCKNDMFDLAIQLIEEQQEYILKLSNSVRNARKAAKGNLVGLLRAQNELLRNKNHSESMLTIVRNKYNKLFEKMMILKRSLKQFRLTLAQESIADMIKKQEEKEELEKELGLK